MKDIHIRLLEKMKKKSPPISKNDLVSSGFKGVGWASSGGESYALGQGNIFCLWDPSCD